MGANRSLATSCGHMIDTDVDVREILKNSGGDCSRVKILHRKCGNTFRGALISDKVGSRKTIEVMNWSIESLYRLSPDARLM